MRTLSICGGPLALCVWLAGCGLPGYRAGAPAVGGAADSDETSGGAVAVQPLLRLGSDGQLLPGRATWSVEGEVVTLDFGTGAAGAREGDGPVGSALVRTWPRLDEPPWLGHRVRGIAVEGDRVHVEFVANAADRARIFADLRLSGAGLSPVEGDARDAIDAGDAQVVTHHDASIEYARSLGRSVERIAFDRLYLAVFARGAGPEGPGLLADEVARDWVGWGAPGARRASRLADSAVRLRPGAPTRTASRWTFMSERCGMLVGGAAVAARSGGGGLPSGRAPPPRQPTISYPEGDQAARQAAERLVSAGMRGGAEADAMAALTGSTERLAVRAASGENRARAQTDVAGIVVVHAGPGHPCSLHAEVLRAAAAWGLTDGAPDARILFLGEAASFLVGREAP